MILKRRNRRRSKQLVKPELRTIVETPIATIADTRTMSELLQAPTEGYGDAIVIAAIIAKNFELKVRLLSLVTSSQFHGFETDDPYSHIRWFNKITSMLKYKNVPHDTIKFMLYLFSLEWAAWTWLEKEPPRSIHTWEDLVSKFVNYFFPPSKTTNLKNDIMNFQQRLDETFSEAWDHFKDLFRKCPHYGFSKLHQIDTFYNELTQSDQDSLNAAAGNVTAFTEIFKKLLLNVKGTQQATVKAIEETCVICGGPHPYYECLPTGGNTFDAYAAIGTCNQEGNRYRPQGDLNYRARNQIGPPGFSPLNVQNSQNQNCFADALLYMPKFASTFKSLLELEESLALADLGASINLMPLSIWKKLFLREFTPTRMTLELANQIIDYDVDPWVPLILGRPFLRTTRALIDESVNRIDVIDVSCKEYAQEVLGFLDSLTSGNPTPSDPIIASSSPSFTPFEGGDFILEEIKTFLRTLEELSNLDDDYYDTKGDILYLEKLLNEDPSPNLPSMKNEDLKQVDVTMKKSFIEEPPELELKDLPSHLEYAFLEGTNKLPIIISKELKMKKRLPY
nr:reverse transcriptase domain-containing protein [Tanacetum cinerariifolium]